MVPFVSDIVWAGILICFRKTLSGNQMFMEHRSVPAPPKSFKDIQSDLVLYFRLSSCPTM